MRGLVAGVIARYAARLRFPRLLLVTASLLLLDLLIPDVIPFIDEILLALGTLLFAALTKPRVREGP